MKIKLVSIVFLLVSASVIFSSYRNGAAQHGGWDCSGGESGLSNPTGCASGGGCHASSATAGITVVLELDSAGIPVTGYWPGQTYTVKVTGTNTTSSTLPGFGFQITATVGTTELATPTTAGTWGTAPAGAQVAAPQANNFVLSVFEQSSVRQPASGSGGTGTTYIDSITWTAPVAGTGSISLWTALNAVNNNGNADGGDLWNVAHIVITEDTISSTNTGVINITPANGVSMYPNPVSDMLNLQWDNTQAGSTTLAVYTTTGQLITTQHTEASNYSLNTAAWAPGIYLVNVHTGNVSNSYRVFKQ